MYQQKTERRECGSDILKHVSRHTKNVVGLGRLLTNEFRTVIEPDHTAQRGETIEYGDAVTDLGT